MDQDLRGTGGVALSALALLPGIAAVPLPAPSLTASDLLFALGLLALFFEIVHPGAHLLGILGAVALIVGGALLLQSGLWLPVLLMLAGFGWLFGVSRRGSRLANTLPGLLAFAAGALFMTVRGVSLLVTLPLIAAVAAGSLLIVALVRRSRAAQPMTGAEALVGSSAVTVGAVAPRGQVRLHGELWAARSLSGALDEGATVRVVGFDGLTLLVETDAPGPQEDLRSVSARASRVARRDARS